MSKEKFPKAVASGKIKFGNIEIDCAVLDDGTQVITRNSILKFMGKSNGGGRPTKEIISLRASGVQIPIFVASNNLIPFITKDLSSRSTPLIFIPLKGGRAHGYKADLILDICEIYSDASKAKDVLKKNQIPIAVTLDIIYKGMARVGISALVLEACGIPNTEKEYFQRILNQYIEKSLQPWIRRFPKSFFENYKLLYGLNKESKVPMHIGYFINTFIYQELAPGVLEELKILNPINENGRRSHAHHQFLTPNKGIQELEKQLIKVNTVMRMSKNKSDFNDKYKLVKGNDNG